MKQKLDLDSCNRKDHFLFFKQFDEPFYGVTVKLDCTAAYCFAKEKGVSFFLYTMHRALAAANGFQPLKLRIENDEV